MKKSFLAAAALGSILAGGAVKAQFSPWDSLSPANPTSPFNPANPANPASPFNLDGGDAVDPKTLETLGWLAVGAAIGGTLGFCIKRAFE